ncbi:UNVERIFIED_CONTAM: hypothetical protein FKN15_076254 [Acipenser sinensis]
MNTRCPPKRVPLATCFFPEDNTALGSLQAAGAQPDHRGRCCTVSRGHCGRPSPPSTWELPSSVGKRITWTRTGNVQAIGRILHSTRSTLATRFFPEDNTALGSLQAAGAQPDHRGRCCTVSRGQCGRPSPPSTRAALGQLCAAPWELPSSVGKRITWTRTGNVQAIGRILHSTRSTLSY